MLKAIIKNKDYNPSVALFYMKTIKPKIESMQKFTTTSSYMFSIKDEDNPFDTYAFQMAQKYANAFSLCLDKTSNYTSWCGGKRTTNISVNLRQRR